MVVPPPPPGTVLHEGPEHSTYNENRKRTFQCLLDAGARINNVRVHPKFDWTPLSVALRIKFGWDILLERGVILDEASLDQVEEMIIYAGELVAEKFLLQVSDKNLDEHIRSK